MKQLIIIFLVSICVYSTSKAQSISTSKKGKSTVQSIKKKLPPPREGGKFLPPEIKKDVQVETNAVENVFSPEPPPEEVIGTMSTTVEIDAPPVQLSDKEYNEHYGTVQASYSAGNQTFFDMLSRRIKMPDAAKEKGIKDNVELEFSILQDGALNDIKVKKSLGYGCDEEAIRVMKALGNWSPARNKGKAYTSLNTILVAFGIPQERNLVEHQTVVTEVADKEEQPPLDPDKVLQIEKPQESDIFKAVEQQAEFVGGITEFGKFIAKNLKYPAPAQRANVSGKVYIQFVVNKDGSTQNFEVLKSVGFGCDEEALRLLKSVMKWSPAKQSGLEVRSLKTVPINFQISE
jgi:TonB family protein